MLLNAEEIISKSWRDYISNWHDWAIYSLILFIPGFILMLSGSFGGFLNTYLPATAIATNILILILVVVSAIMWFWSYLALTHAVGKFLQTKQTDHWKEHYSASLETFWPALYISILKGIIVAVGTVLFLIPGIIFAVWYSFVLFGVILSGERGWSALSSSKNLVRGRWWGVAWRLLLPTIVFGVGVALLNIVLSLLINTIPLSSESNVLVNNIISGLSSAIFAPLTTIAALNLYLSLKENPASETMPQPVA